MQKSDGEKLNIYQSAVESIVWTTDLLADISKTFAVHNQLDPASTSIPLNIAVGNGKRTSTDRCRFFDSPFGSALECAACLDVLLATKTVDGSGADEGTNRLVQIVSTLVGLIRRSVGDRENAVFSVMERLD